MDIETLYRQAQQALERSDYSTARELGHQLLKARFSGAFEILAASFRGQGQLPVALQVLESGVKEAPGVWMLWMQLGNYRSEAGDLEGALQAYLTAKSQPGADLDQLDFNEGYLRLRFGNKQRALELFRAVIERTKDKSLRVVALTHRLRTLIQTEQVTEALMELGEAQLHEADNAELLSDLAFLLLSRGDAPNALNLAKQALGLRRAGEVARVVRLIEGERTTCGRLFEVQFRGTIEGDDGLLHFKKHTRVVAENSQEAVDLALAFEPPDVQPDLICEHVGESELSTDDEEPNKGVDWSGPLEFYQPKIEDPCI